MNKLKFYVFFVLVTGFISLVSYNPPEIIILGPNFHEHDYFEEELDLISNELGIKIKYETVVDPETFLIENPNNKYSIAIIPNPQGVVNLAEKGLIYNLQNLYIDENEISIIYSQHLNSIVSYNNEIYAGWLRLLPNSLIWYDIKKLEKQNVSLDSFESMINDTNQIADLGTSPWCLNSESAASSGWVQTNWLEDIILTKYGPDVYDKWSNLDIKSSNIKIYSSVKLIGDLVFYPNHVFGGKNSIIFEEFRNLPKILFSDSSDCFLSWSGHYFRYFIPENLEYEVDYGVVSFPKINFEDTVVGIGDNVVLVKNNKLSREVVSKILSKDFGNIWSSYSDTEFISANKFFDSKVINNELTVFEFDLIHKALKRDVFRYDSSELMARPIGSNKLWIFFNDYISAGPDALVRLLNNLDKEF